MGAPSKPGRRRFAPCSVERASTRCSIDAELAVSRLPAASPWHPVSILLQGMAVLLSGDLERAEAILDQAAEAAVAGGAVWAGVVARSERALLALERGDVAAAESELALARAFLEDAPSADYVVTAILLAVTARLAIAKGQGARAREALVSAQRMRPMMTHALSWFAVQAAARAREGASRPVGRTRRGDAPSRGGRHPSSTPEARHARRAGRRRQSETLDGRRRSHRAGHPRSPLPSFACCPC